MHTGHEVWSVTNEEGTSVAELEHMFGFDVVWYTFSQTGHPIPNTIVTRTTALTTAERQKAVRAAIWRDSERFDIFAMITSALATEGTL